MEAIFYCFYRELTIRQGLAPRRQTWQRVDWIVYFVFRANFDRYERAHTDADVFGGNNTTTHKLLLLGRFTEFTFCLDFSDKRKPRNELRSMKKVFSK